MTDETPEAGDEFNPRDYPETFTPEILRKMSMREMLILEDKRDQLSPEQQQSFRKASAVVLGPAMNAISGALGQNVLAASKYRVSPDLLASFNTVHAKIANQARIASRIRPDIVITQSGDARIFPPAATARASAPAPVISTTEDDAALEESTVGEFEREVDRDTEMLAVLRSMATMMTDHQLSATRNKFFTVIVSMAVIVAGVAPIVAAADWSERFWIIGISAVLGLLAYGAYRITLRKQSKQT